MMVRSFNRALIGVGLALMGALAFGQLDAVPDQKLSITYPPTRLEMLLPKLGAQVGVGLACGVQIQNEVLVVAVHDVSSREILRRIASVTNATWRARDKGLILERTPANEHAEQLSENEFFDRSWVRFRETLAKSLLPAFDDKAAVDWVKQYGKAQQDIRNLPAGRDDENAQFRNRLMQKIQGLLQGSPAKRLLGRMLLESDSKTFASVPNGETYVYSTAPNRMQFKLPSRAGALLQEFRQENNRLFSRVASSNMVGTSQGDWTASSLKQSLRSVDPKAVAIVSVSSRSQGFLSFVLTVANPDGEVVASTAEWMYPVPFDTTLAGIPTNILSETVEMPPLVTEAVDMVSSRRGKSQKPKAISAKLMPYVVDPVANELLSLSSASILPEVAEKLGTNLVVDVSDAIMGSLLTMAYQTRNGEPKRLTVRDVLSSLVSTGAHPHLEDGWLTAQPPLLGSQRATRVDRTVLKRYLSITLEDRTPNVSEWLSLAADPRSANLETFLAYGTVCFADSILTEMHAFGQGAWFAKLNPVQRQQALSPQGCPLSTLSADQRREVERFVFYSTDTRNTPLTSKTAPMGRGMSYLQYEPTFAFPDGLPANARLVVQSNSNSLVYTVPASGRPIYTDATNLGWQAYTAEKQGRPSPLPSKVLVSNMYFATGILMLGDYQKQLGSFQINEFDLRKVVPYKSAPRTFLDQVDQGYQNAKKSSGKG